MLMADGSLLKHHGLWVDRLVLHQHGRDYPGHQHPEFEINLLTGQPCGLLLGGKVWTIEPGQAVLYWGGLPHGFPTVDSSTHCELRWLTIPLPFGSAGTCRKISVISFLRVNYLPCQPFVLSGWMRPRAWFAMMNRLCVYSSMTLPRACCAGCVQNPAVLQLIQEQHRIKNSNALPGERCSSFNKRISKIGAPWLILPLSLSPPTRDDGCVFDGNMVAA